MASIVIIIVFPFMKNNLFLNIQFSVGELNILDFVVRTKVIYFPPLI